MRRLSPVARRRFERFRNNRRGWWSLWLFCALFIISLCGELIANDKPLVLSYQHELYFPAFKRHTEQEFGGQLPFQPDYRSDYVRQLISKGDGWMLFSPITRSAMTHLTTTSTSPHPARLQRSTGWAPTIRRATCWPESSSARGSRSCSPWR